MAFRSGSALALAMFLSAGTLAWAQPEGAGAPAGEVKPAPVSDPAAKALLDESIKAIKDLKSLRYTVKYANEGMGEAFSLATEGKVLWIRPTEPKSNLFQFMGTMNLASEGVKEVRLASFAPQRVVFVDPDAKRVYDEPFNQAAQGTKWVARVQKLALPEFLSEPEPMAKLARARVLTIEGPMEVHGESCTVVHAVIEEGKSEARVAIGNIDKIPRMFMRRRTEKNMSVGPIWELRDVSLQEVTPKDLEIPTPEGYTLDKKDAPAPGTVPNPPGVNIGPSKGTTMSPVGGLPAGSTLPAFNAQFADGSKFDAASLNGKVTVLGFWQPQVAASADLASALQKVSDDFKGQNVQVIAVGCREGADAAGARSFMEAHGVRIPTLVSADAVANAMNVRGFPSVMIVGSDSKVAAFLEGATSHDAIAGAVKSAMKH